MDNISTFLSNGYVIVDFTDISKIQKIVKDKLQCENLNNYSKKSNLNKVKLKLVNDLSNTEFKEFIYNGVKNDLNHLLGSELSVQKKVNVNIQLPEDDSFLLPIHSDVLCGNSPYEVTVWLPLVDVENTKSIFIYDYKTSMEIIEYMKNNKSVSEVESEFGDKKKFLRLDVGQCLIFFPGLIHGNVINKETSTRVSLNIRFKNLHAPFSDKDQFGYYEDFRVSPVTKMALKYKRDCLEKSL